MANLQSNCIVTNRRDLITSRVTDLYCKRYMVGQPSIPPELIETAAQPGIDVMFIMPQRKRTYFEILETYTACGARLLPRLRRRGRVRHGKWMVCCGFNVCTFRLRRWASRITDRQWLVRLVRDTAVVFLS